MKTVILVATHKEYKMPSDSLYAPIHVGKALSNLALPYLGDNTGDHISEKNPYYCELTALYFAWKNMDADYMGLAHYRRHFTLHKPLFIKKDKFSCLLTKQEAETLLKEHWQRSMIYLYMHIMKKRSQSKRPTLRCAEHTAFRFRNRIHLHMFLKGMTLQ